MFGGPTEIIVILVIVLVIFGASRLKNIGSDLGSAIKGFRSAVKEDPDSEEETSEADAKSSDSSKSKSSKRKNA